MNRFQKLVTASLGVTALAVPTSSALAAAQTKVVVTRKVTGLSASAGQWGYVQVTLTVRKTTTTVGTKKTIARKIIRVGVPVYPNHTDRSVYINQTALPYLIQETLTAQTANIQMISGASDSSYAYIQSLQRALVLEKKV
jgi:FMN-binding domain.